MDTFAATLDLIRKKPDLIQVLKRIIAYEEQHKGDQYFKDLGWEYDDFKPPIKPQTLYQLFLAGVLDKPYDSRSHTGYLLMSRPEVRRAIEEFETMEEPLEIEESVEPPEDLFESIVGYEDVKDVFKKALESEEPVWILLTGSPASAKTMFVMEIERLPASYLALGPRSTKAGLSKVLIERKPRFLIIDQLERMNTQDMDVLLGLYQTGLVVETIAPKPRRVKLKTWVFASANTLKGIPRELLSRFLRFRFREYGRPMFLKTVVSVLQTREGVGEVLAKHIAEQVWFEFDSKDPRDAVRIARLCKTEGEVDKLLETMKKYRN